MPSRKFSAETVTTRLDITDVVPLTRDPAGTPTSFVTPAASFWAPISQGPLTPITAADLGAYALPNGGSVGGVTVTPIAGNTIGSISDILQIDIDSPTLPGAGPCIVTLPITLVGGIPNLARMSLSTVPGAIPVDYSYGFLLATAGSEALVLYTTRYLVPPATRKFEMAEFDPASGSPAAWQSADLTYSTGEDTEYLLRTVMPFAASPLLPQLQMNGRSVNYASGYEDIQSAFFGQYPTSGSFNASGNWDGATLTTMSLMFIFGTAYVGTVSIQLYAAKSF